MSKLTTLLKNIFFILLILQFTPPIIQNLIDRYNKLYENKTQVGVIEIKGGLYSAKKHVKHIKEFFENKDIKAILLKVECPGGAAGTSQAIYSEILALKEKNGTKPVVALVENICASGGYYVAAAADYIVASPSAMVGSIGVYIAHPQFKDFIEQFKVKYTVTKSGLYKTAGDPLTELTDEAKAMFQNLTNDVYNQFVNDIKARRSKLAAIDEKSWAEGRVFTGNEAFRLGLIDEVGSYSNAVKAIKDKAIIEGEIEWVKPPKKSNIWKVLVGDDENGGETKSLSDRFISSLVNKFINQSGAEETSPRCNI